MKASDVCWMQILGSRRIEEAAALWVSQQQQQQQVYTRNEELEAGQVTLGCQRISGCHLGPTCPLRYRAWDPLGGKGSSSLRQIIDNWKSAFVICTERIVAIVDTSYRQDLACQPAVNRCSDKLFGFVKFPMDINNSPPEPIVSDSPRKLGFFLRRTW